MNPDHPVRIKVACINWTSPYVVPLASVTTVNANGEYLLTKHFAHWSEAMRFADRLAGYIRTSHQLTEGADQ